MQSWCLSGVLATTGSGSLGVLEPWSPNLALLSEPLDLPLVWPKVPTSPEASDLCP